MKNIFNLLSAEAKPDESSLTETASTPGDNRPETEANPVKQRGIFLPGKFSAGRAPETTLPHESPSGAFEETSESGPKEESTAISPVAIPPSPAVTIPGDSQPESNPAFSGTVLTTADTLAGALALAATLPAVPDDPFTKPSKSDMIPTNLTPAPGSGQASAQLTLGFEMTSLQFSSFFKLAAMQLKAISNVVTLHLVTAQQGNEPLAAGISFQIAQADLDEASHLKSLLLKPLGDQRKVAAPSSGVRLDHMLLSGDHHPISMMTAAESPTVVHLFGTFAIAAMEFTPAFEIGALRLEATSNRAFVSVDASFHPAAQTPPPSFEITAVQVDADKQIVGMRVVSEAAKSV